MNNPTALVAHPYPIVVDALAALVTAAGYSVTRASDAAAAAAGLAATPDLALVAATLGGVGAADARHGTMRTLVIGDDIVDDAAIRLTAPVDRVVAQIAVAAGAQRAAGTTPALTPRERDVARLVTAGQRNRAIAATLGISEGTVKMHLHNVYAKLGLESRTQLAMSTRVLVD